jgi:opacity protein-like surface antigen
MKRVRTWSAALAAGLVAIVLGGGSASAEVFFDLYGGASNFGDPDFTVSREGQARETERASADTDFTVGGRGGYWFDRQNLRWLGVALDISYFEPEYTPEGGTGNVAKVKVRTVPITPLVMFRLPLLESPQHPNGQLQLYTGAGLGIFILDTTVRFLSGAGEVSKEGASIGVDLRAGVAYEFLPNWAAFAEYRFTHFSVEPEGRVDGQKTKVEIDLDAHHVLFGVSYRFR